jgi:hypothetical protein
MNLNYLDQQMATARRAVEHPQLPDDIWSSLATTIHGEVAAITEVATNRLRQSLLIPPERYYEELTAFQSWTDIARAHEGTLPPGPAERKLLPQGHRA